MKAFDGRRQREKGGKKGGEEEGRKEGRREERERGEDWMTIDFSFVALAFVLDTFFHIANQFSLSAPILLRG